MVYFEFSPWTKLYYECYTFYLEKHEIIFPNCIIQSTALFNKNPHILSIFEYIILFLFTIVLFFEDENRFLVLYIVNFIFLASEHVKSQTSLYNKTSSIFIDTFYLSVWGTETSDTNTKQLFVFIMKQKYTQHRHKLGAKQW